MFLNNDFLLENEWAKKLYHGYAVKMPIIDYHCHLDAKEIYQDRIYENITKLWLNDNGQGDHYKWRLLRANGVDENLITGSGNDFEKFQAFAQSLEKAVGNPIFEWSHLELKRYFNINKILNKDSAFEIYQEVNKQVQSKSCSVQNLLRKMNVQALCTTDDPVDSLEYHKKINNDYDNIKIKVLPTFRPDKACKICNTNYLEYLTLLEDCSNIKINNLHDFKQALTQRVEFFNSVGCKLSDHGLDEFYFQVVPNQQIEEIFNKALKKQIISKQEEIYFSSNILHYLMGLYTKNNWTMQLHINVSRDNSSKMLKEIGINIGADCIGTQADIIKHIINLFDYAQQSNTIPKTIVYSLNNNDFMSIATAVGCFQGNITQKIIFGNAWWFNDTRKGMVNQLEIMANQSLLGNFTGMLTDSRSFLSYPRHEYFRRILCNLIGEYVVRGQLPESLRFLGETINNICYTNAFNYFGFFNK